MGKSFVGLVIFLAGLFSLFGAVIYLPFDPLRAYVVPLVRYRDAYILIHVAVGVVLLRGGFDLMQYAAADRRL